MRKIILLAAAVVICRLSFAQTISAPPHEPDRLTLCPIITHDLYISDRLSTTLLFPYPVRRVSWTNKALMVQQPAAVRNMIELKAARSFPPANLSIVTTDGRFYSFVLRYDVRPGIISFRIEPDTLIGNGHPFVLPDDDRVNDAMIDSWTEAVLHHRERKLKRQHTRDKRITLTGVYSAGDLLWIRLKLDNISSIRLMPADMRVMVTDRRTMRNTVQQQRPIAVIAQRLDMIAPRGHGTVILAVPMLPLPARKKIVVRIFEKNTDAFIAMTLTRRTLRHLQPL